MPWYDFETIQSKIPSPTRTNTKDRLYSNDNRHNDRLLLLLLLSIIQMSSFCSALSSPRLLRGKRVLVTGAGRGIGRAIALICHEEGAKVVVTSRTESELEETVRLAASTDAETNEADEKEEEKELRLQKSAVAAMLLARRGGKGAGKTASSSSSNKATSVGARRTGSASKARMGRSSVSQLVDAVKTGSSAVSTVQSSTADEDGSSESMVYYVCDVTDEQQVDSMIEEVVRSQGDIDILINNAGGSSSKGPVGTLEGQDLANILKLNVMSPQLVTSAVCKHSWTTTTAMTSNSKTTTEENPNPPKVILNISSKAGKVGLQNYSFYVASKFALEGLTSSWSKELSSSNVRVHSISPGMVNTKSFPKPDGKEGVRTAGSIRDCLLFCLTGNVVVNDSGIGDDDETNNDSNSGKVKEIVEDMMDYTGHYIHVDEYDQVIREKGIGEAYLAWKPIDEDQFRV